MNWRYVRRELKRPIAWARKRRRPRALVLMYHGVGDGGVDPWELFISEQRFEQHLDAITTFGTPVPLADLAEGLADGEIPDKAVVITFDDGYANNLHLAAPVLERQRVPATMFAVSTTIGSSREFWWDELAAIVLTPGDLPHPLELVVGDTRHVLDIGTARSYPCATFEADCAAREGDQQSERVALYHRIWQLLVDCDSTTRERSLAMLAATTGHSLTARESHRVMNAAELLEFDGRPGMAVGAHTLTHPILPKLARDEQRDEILGSFRDLAGRLGHSLDTFSYPFGAHDQTTLQLAAASPATATVTVNPETACPQTEPHAIPRFDVRDWPADVLARRLERWWRFL